MRNLPGTCGFFLLSTALAGQVSKSSPAILLSQPTQGCPVELSANRLASGNVIHVQSGKEQPRPAMRVNLQPALGQSDNPSGRGVVSATVTLHGLSGRQVVPAGSFRAGEATEEFTFTPSAHGNRGYSGTVYLGRLTAVTSVELNEITFADGTHWHEAAGSVCQVAPNGYMLVAEAEATSTNGVAR